MESANGSLQLIQLSKAQRDALKPHLDNFKRYAQSESFTSDLEGGGAHMDFFQQEIPRRLQEFSEADLVEMLSNLWTARMWGNRSYLAQKIVSANGIEELGKELSRLWDTTLTVADRYDNFLGNISYFGPAALTETMCYIEPNRCGFWNQRSREALKVLGFDSFVRPAKYKITGAEYETFNRLLAAIASEVKNLALRPQSIDLFIVNCFLFQVAQSASPEERGAASGVTAGHDEIRDMLAAIGAILGFDTDVEFSIAHGAKVDVVWRARIGNLGVVTYVFEVQKGGSIDSLILNLQKAKNSPTVQKVIAVSDDDQLQKIERETQGLQAEFRNALAFWKISEVQQVSQSLQAASEIINKLGLVPGKS